MASIAEFTIWNAKSAETLTSELVSCIDTLGIESGVAQGLNGPITAISKLSGTDQQLIVFSDCSAPTGFIKFGTKDLYFYLKNGKVVQKIGAVCVLDFYVRPSHQRNGVGLLLFQEMLKMLDDKAAFQLAYDRPSPKLFSFLSKHYGLVNPDVQPNRYAIYAGYLDQ